MFPRLRYVLYIVTLNTMDYMDTKILDLRGVRNEAWISYTMWLNLTEYFESLSVLFWTLVTLYKKIRKSQEILGSQDSANPWILSESIKIQNLVRYFLHIVDPSLYYQQYMHIIYTARGVTMQIHCIYIYIDTFRICLRNCELFVTKGFLYKKLFKCHIAEKVIANDRFCKSNLEDLLHHNCTAIYYEIWINFQGSSKSMKTLKSLILKNFLLYNITVQVLLAHIHTG